MVRSRGFDSSVKSSMPNILAATPETPTVAALTITTAVTSFYILRADSAWRFLLLRLSANNNVVKTKGSATIDNKM